MADKKTTYSVEVKTDQGKARAEAAKLASIFQTELKKLSLGSASGGSGASKLSADVKAAVSAAKAAEAQLTATVKAEAAARVQASRAEAQERITAAKTIATQTQGGESRLTAIVKADSTARVASARSESQERIQAARAAAAGVIEQERRTTASVKAEIAQRRREEQKAAQAARGSRTADTTGGLATLAKGYVTLAAARQVADFAVKISQVRTENLRAATSFEILSGGAGKASDNLRAIQAAAGGTVDRLTAMRVGSQAAALGLANTAEQMGALTQAARAVALVSPVINDVQSALGELTLFSANEKSFQRADQLGLTAREVKDRMKELQAENSALSGSEAKLAASIELLNEKFGGIVNSSVASASGLEKLQVGFNDLIGTLSLGGGTIDGFFGKLAQGLTSIEVAAGGGGIDAKRAALENQIKALDQGGTEYGPILGAAMISNEAETRAVLEVFELVNSKQAETVTGIEGFKAIVDEVTATTIRWGGATGEQLKLLEAIGNTVKNADTLGVRVDNTATIEAEASRAAYEKQQAQLIELSGAYEEADARLGVYAEQLASTGIGVEEFTKKLDLAKGFLESQDQVIEAATKTAAGLVEALGVEGAGDFLDQQKGQIVDFYNELEAAGKTSGPDLQLNVAALESQLAAAAAKVEEFGNLQEAGEGQIQDNARQLVERFGIDQALVILEQQKAAFNAALSGFQAQGLEGPALDFSLEAINAQLTAQVDAIIAQSDRLAQGVNFDAAIAQINSSLAGLNSGTFDSMDGIAALRDELYGLTDAIAFSGYATDEQAARISYLAAVSFAATDSASAYSQIQAILGVEFLTTNDYANALVQQIILLDAAQAAGQIGAIQHASGLAVLTGEIYNSANAAGAAAPALAQLLGLVNALKGAAAGGIGTPEFARGQAGARATVARERGVADTARRRQVFDQQQKSAQTAARGAAKEQGKAARGAGSAFNKAARDAATSFNKAAKSTKEAFENAAKTLESALRKVPGLFGASEVTQEQMDIAAAGGSVNFADDYVRRLRDEVENGKDWEGVSIEQARDALSKVGIQVGESSKEVLAKFEQAWSDSSLFADKANLALINQDAVRQQLQIQDKIKEGQKNILDLFGATVDGVMAGVKAGDAVATGLVAGELAGSDDKALQELAKGLRENNEAAIAKVIELANAEMMEMPESGGGGGGSAGGLGGGGGGGGGALGLDPAIFAPGDYEDFFDPLIDGISEAGAEAGATAGKEFFAGFAAYMPKEGLQGKGMFGPQPNPAANPQADLAAFLTNLMPTLPAVKAPGALGALPAVAGPALTVEPKTASDYAAALSAELAKPENKIAVVPTIDAAITDVEAARTSILERMVIKVAPTIDATATEVGPALTNLQARLAVTVVPTIDAASIEVGPALTNLAARLAVTVTPFVDATKTDVSVARLNLTERLSVLVTPFVDATLTDVSTARTTITEQLAVVVTPQVDASLTDVAAARTNLTERMAVIVTPSVEAALTDVSAARTALTERMVVTVTPTVDASLTDVSFARTLLTEQMALVVTPQIDATLTDVGTSRTALTEKMPLILTPQIDTSLTDTETARITLTEKMPLVLQPYIDVAGFSINEDMAGALSSALSTQFAGESGRFSGIGGTAALQVQTGFLAYEYQNLGGDFATDLNGSMARASGVLSGIGGVAASHVAQGFGDYDFSGVAAGTIADLRAAFTSDVSISMLRSVGAAWSSSIFAGFRDSLAYAPWLDSIREALVGQAITDVTSSVKSAVTAAGTP